jgi:hypothetical protein
MFLNFIHYEKMRPAAGDTGRQAQDIDQRKGLIFQKMPEGNCKVIFKHNARG